jgi:hypothetical protein
LSATRRRPTSRSGHADDRRAAGEHDQITPTGLPPIEIPISGSVVTAELTTPNVMSLGTFCVGQPTTPTTVALRSTGTATIGLPVAPAMMQPSPCTLELVSPASYPAQLDPMGEASVIITPERGSAAGVAMGTLAWTTDAGNDARR